jgi:hypothetical protein
MRISALLLVVSCSLAFGYKLRAVQTPQELEDTQQCRRNLQLIYQAIQAYRGVKNDLPNELAELSPHFLSDIHLVCPAARHIGLSSMDLVGWGSLGPTTYDYEFTPRLIPAPILGTGATRSMREWKQLQMGLIGSDVPMVRCHMHQQVLNLSFGGEIFGSDALAWENNFVDLVSPCVLFFPSRFGAYTVEKKIVVPTRDRQASATMIDLSNYYNVLFDEAWPSREPLRPFLSLPPGVVQFNGSGFDVRGAIQLRALRPGLVPYPVAVTNVVVGFQARQVHLLLGSAYSAHPEAPVAECIFHLADGRRQRLQLLYGAQLASCFIVPGEPFSPLRDARVAWSAGLSDGSVVRLYQCEWTNPAPDQRIESMDFLAGAGNAGPILVAVSVGQSL